MKPYNLIHLNEAQRRAVEYGYPGYAVPRKGQQHNSTGIDTVYDQVQVKENGASELVGMKSSG